MHAVGRDYLRSPNGQAWQQDVQEYSQAAQTREQQAAWEAPQLQHAAEQMHRPNALRMCPALTRKDPHDTTNPDQPTRTQPIPAPAGDHPQTPRRTERPS